jgi:hypothetical protein
MDHLELQWLINTWLSTVVSLTETAFELSFDAHPSLITFIHL